MDETPAPDEDDTTAMVVDPDAVDPEVPVDGSPDADAGSGSRGVSKATLILSILAAALVAGVAGVAIGWKVEQQRVKDDLANIRPIGTVSAVDDDSITVNLSSASGNRTYEITEATVIDGESGGDTSALEEGATVLVKSQKTDGELEALEVVVFPEGTTFGRG